MIRPDSTVDENRFAGDVGRIVAQQKQCRADAILRLPHLTERNIFGCVIQQFRRICYPFCETSVDQARSESIETQARRTVNREGSNDTTQSRTRRIVSEMTGLGLLGIDRSDPDKTRTVIGKPGEFSRKKVATTRFDIDRFVPNLDCTAVTWITFKINACAMDDTVEAAESFVRFPDECLRFRLRPHVGAHVNGSSIGEFRKLEGSLLLRRDNQI